MSKPKQALTVRLVLQIMEGSNFHNFDRNSLLVLRGKIENIELVSDPVPLSSIRGLRLEIAEELVWKMSARNFQRIKASKALKLDCFVYLPNGPKTCVGYTIIILKSVTHSSQSTHGWRKLLGCSSNNSPQLLLSVALIDDKDTVRPDFVLKPAPGQFGEEKKITLARKVDEINGKPTDCTVKNGITYVGSERFCKERFECTCTLFKASHLDQLLTEKEIQENFSKKPFRLQLKLFGQELNSMEFELTEPNVSFNQGFVFDILSKTGTLKQFMSEDPSVEIALLNGNTAICRTKHFLDSLELGHQSSAAIFLYGKRDSDLQPKVTLSLLISSLDGGGTPAKEPKPRKESVVDSPFPSAPVLLDEDTEIEIISGYSRLGMESELEEMMRPEKVVESYHASPKHRAAEETRQLREVTESQVEQRFEYKQYSKKSSENARSCGCDTERMTKVVEELEDWKLKQKVLFTAEMKAERERMEDEWNDRLKERQMHLEYESVSKIQKSKELSSSLERELEKLQQKSADLEREQQKFQRCKRILEDKLAEQNEILLAQKKDYESRVNILLYQAKQLQQKVDMLESERTRLKNMQGNQSAEVLELKEKLREMQESAKRAEEEKANLVKEQEKALQRARCAAASDNRTNKNFMRERLMKDKDSLEQLKTELNNMNQNSTKFESAAALRLQHQREAFLRSGVYDAESELIKTMDRAIQQARSDGASGDED